MWGSLATATRNASGSLLSSYSPRLLFDGQFLSSGNQLVIFARDPGLGFEAGANVFLGRRAGFQLFVDRVSSDLPGTSTPYAVTLQYISRQPPTSQEQAVDVRQSTPWPATAGSLTQLTLGANGLVRLGRTSHVNVELSGGICVERLSGAVQPLGFTTFRLGGHSVLFQDDYRLAVSLEPAGAVGFNVGGEANVPLGRYAALVLGYRYVGGPTVEMTVRPKAILNAEELIFQQSIAEIATQLTAGPAHVGVSGSRLVVGLKLRRRRS